VSYYSYGDNDIGYYVGYIFPGCQITDNKIAYKNDLYLLFFVWKASYEDGILRSLI
jgi:hypothetical protein